VALRSWRCCHRLRRRVCSTAPSRYQVRLCSCTASSSAPLSLWVPVCCGCVVAAVVVVLLRRHNTPVGFDAAGSPLMVTNLSAAEAQNSVAGSWLDMSGCGNSSDVLSCIYGMSARDVVAAIPSSSPSTYFPASPAGSDWPGDACCCGCLWVLWHRWTVPWSQHLLGCAMCSNRDHRWRDATAAAVGCPGEARH
jgi:hypothetical protein